MTPLFRWPLLPGALLLVAAQAACAQVLPDPVAPAVVGRPLDQIKPARTAPAKPPARSAAARPATPKVAAATATATMGAAAAVAPPVAAPAPSAPVAAAQSAGQRVAKQAVDDRADAHAEQLSEVGKGSHFARKPLAEGAYFGERHRAAARRYYAANPVMRPAVKWKIGEPVPREAVVALVPRPLLAALPPVPPGHQYVELGGEVVLVATASKMVVDGISRTRNETALLAR